MKKRLPDFGAYVITSGDHVRIASEAVKAGARILQYRDKNASRRVMLEMARQIRGITAESGTRFVINDYLDLAMLGGADGVHLGQGDIPLAEARRVLPAGIFIGVSVSSLEQAYQAQNGGADYIGIGPVFNTPTKPEEAAIGLDVVREVVRSVSIPVVAIGGINLQNMGELQRIGIRSVAMVREFQNNTARVVKAVNSLFLQ